MLSVLMLCLFHRWHMCEASLVYKLVSMKNKIFLSEKLILQKIEEQSHTLTSFSRYVTTIMLNNYLIYVSSILVALVVVSDC